MLFPRRSVDFVFTTYPPTHYCHFLLLHHSLVPPGSALTGSHFPRPPHTTLRHQYRPSSIPHLPIGAASCKSALLDLVLGRRAQPGTTAGPYLHPTRPRSCLSAGPTLPLSTPPALLELPRLETSNIRAVRADLQPCRRFLATVWLRSPSPPHHGMPTLPAPVGAFSPLMTVDRSSSNASRCNSCNRRTPRTSKRYAIPHGRRAAPLRAPYLPANPPQIWHIAQTGEVFVTYEDYLNRYAPWSPTRGSSG